MSFWTNIYKSSRSLSGIVALVACLLVMGAWPSAAQGAKPTKEELQTFKELVKQGSELRDSGDHWKALDAYGEALEILDHPKLMFTVGKLHQKTGACAEAKDAYTEVLARPKLPDDLRVEVVEQLREADSCESFATLALSCAPDVAKIKVGAESQSCSGRHRLAPGDFEVEVRATGYKSKVIAGTLEAGELFERSVELDLADDHLAGGAGGDAVEPLPADSDSSWMTYTAYGSIGVGTALLIGGLASDYSAQSRAEEFVAANNEGDRARAQSLRDEADSAQVRTVVLYSAGAVLVGGGIALWAIDSQQEGDEDSAAVRAEVGLGAGGPTVRGVLRW